MAKTATLLDIRTQVRQVAGMEQSQFCTDAELNNYINNAYARLYDLLTEKFADDYFQETDSISLVAGTESYDLPDDFYKLTAVDIVISSTQKKRVKRYTNMERNRFDTYSGYINSYGFPSLRYKLSGDQITFKPVPNGAQNIELTYIPVYTTLSDDGDTLDGVNGYEQLIILDAAIMAKIKEETDVTELRYERDKILMSIEAAAENRDANEPQRVNDAYNNSYDDIEFFE